MKFFAGKTSIHKPNANKEFRKAIELDSNFALAYFYYAIGQPTVDDFFTKLEKAVSLVDEISELNEKELQNLLDQNELVEVLHLSNFTEISFVKSLLESENIKFSSVGESVVGKVGGGIMTRIYIRKADIERALPLLKKAGML